MDATHGREDGEADLLAAVAMGRQSAFERLYGLYEKRVYQYVNTLVYDAALAEEIVGDTMLAVWWGAGTYTGTSRVSTWIFGIARHKALDAIRRTSRHRQREVELDGAADMPNPHDRPDEGVLRDELTAVTQRALALLSREHQEILRLVFHEELPYEEISSLLRIPVNTVKTRVYYAKQRLKEQLERMGQKESIP
ncbi:MAG TPA: sigma-70 family RNA polymerase sigma factor [Nitrospira sp.]|nr:sigma-70 family RNA polymerase sigma factor [Nitrospira sp.]